jgi:hypothetical protein
LRKNKLALESMRSFGSKLHIVLLATEKVVLDKPNTPQA